MHWSSGRVLGGVLPAQGCGAIGSAAVSKTAGCRFESCRPCAYGLTGPGGRGPRWIARAGLPPAGTERACGGAVALAPLVPGVRGGLRVSKYAKISSRGRIGKLIAREAGSLVETAAGEPFPD